MILLVLTLFAADADVAAPPSEGLRHGPVVDEGPAPAWQFFAVPAGLSLTSSALLFVPGILLLPFATTTSIVALVVGPPAVAVVGTQRLDDSAVVTGAIIVGDVVGVIVGGVGGYFVWDNFIGEDFSDSVYVNVAVAAGSIVAVAGVARAVGSGLGGVVGHLVSSPDL